MSKKDKGVAKSNKKVAKKAAKTGKRGHERVTPVTDLTDRNEQKAITSILKGGEGEGSGELNRRVSDSPTTDSELHAMARKHSEDANARRGAEDFYGCVERDVFLLIRERLFGRRLKAIFRGQTPMKPALNVIHERAMAKLLINIRLHDWIANYRLHAVADVEVVKDGAIRMTVVRKNKKQKRFTGRSTRKLLKVIRDDQAMLLAISQKMADMGFVELGTADDPHHVLTGGAKDAAKASA